MLSPTHEDQNHIILLSFCVAASPSFVAHDAILRPRPSQTARRAYRPCQLPVFPAKLRAPTIPPRALQSHALLWLARDVLPLCHANSNTFNEPNDGVSGQREGKGERREGRDGGEGDGGREGDEGRSLVPAPELKAAAHRPPWLVHDVMSELLLLKRGGAPAGGAVKTEGFLSGNVGGQGDAAGRRGDDMREEGVREEEREGGESAGRDGRVVWGGNGGGEGVGGGDEGGEEMRVKRERAVEVLSQWGVPVREESLKVIAELATEVSLKPLWCYLNLNPEPYSHHLALCSAPCHAITSYH